MIHDPLCLLAGKTYSTICPTCTLIAKARADERRAIVEQLRAEFPKPTLGIQKAIRMVEGS